jgi:hypothetical protein
MLDDMPLGIFVFLTGWAVVVLLGAEDSVPLLLLVLLVIVEANLFDCRLGF